MIIMKIIQQLCLIYLIALPVLASSTPTVSGNVEWGAEQRMLNDAAASLDMVRHKIIDLSLDHKSKENLVDYLSSLAKPLPYEVQSVYVKRFSGYMDLLNIAASRMKKTHVPKIITDTSTRNLASWNHVKNVKHDLVIQMKRLNVAWKQSLREHKLIDPKLFVTAVQTSLAGYEALRDVRP